MKKIIMALAALACSTTALAMTKPPQAIKDADVTLLASLMKDPADAVDAHKAAGTFTPTLAKSVAGYLKNVATYGGKANTALAAGDPVMFYDHLANLELNKQRACKRLANCRDDGREIRPGV